MECIVCSGATARPLVRAPGASLHGRVEGDRQAANTDTRRVIHGVGNSRSGADDFHLAELIISAAASGGAACLLLQRRTPIRAFQVISLSLRR